MNYEIKKQIFRKIQVDKEFAEKVFNTDNSKEDVQEIAKEAGIEISIEEFDELTDYFIQTIDQQEGELSDDDLEAVAGGVNQTTMVIAGPLFITMNKGNKGKIGKIGKIDFEGPRITDIDL